MSAANGSVDDDAIAPRRTLVAEWWEVLTLMRHIIVRCDTRGEALEIKRGRNILGFPSVAVHVRRYKVQP